MAKRLHPIHPGEVLKADFMAPLGVKRGNSANKCVGKSVTNLFRRNFGTTNCVATLCKDKGF